MSDKTISEPSARAARTLMQGGPALVIAEVVDAFIYDMADRQYGALVALLTLAFAWTQAAIENHKGKAVLREVYTKDVPLTSK